MIVKIMMILRDNFISTHKSRYLMLCLMIMLFFSLSPYKTTTKYLSPPYISSPVLKTLKFLRSYNVGIPKNVQFNRNLENCSSYLLM